MVITPEIVSTVIVLMKIFGTVIVFLLSVICVLGGVIWKDLRAEIKMIKNDSLNLLNNFKIEDEKKCNSCSSRIKDERDSLIKECDDLWSAIEVCCPRVK
ncbi:MAG: hypothetical protein WC055_00500 [Melioribacteraceae bacterium]